MFYSKAENKYVQVGSQFELGGVTYPPQWLYQATDEQKAEIGLEEVIVVGERKDDRYYFVSQTLDGNTLTYVNIPKDLDECKAQAVNEAKSQAYTLLQPTDYIEVRNIKDPAYKPEWVTWRDSVRSTCTARVAEIATVKDVDELAELGNISWPADPSQGV